VLKSMLDRYPDLETRAFLDMVVDSYRPDAGKGLPMGNQTSQWFALYYLDKVDRIIKERYRIKRYTRYMDDLVLIHEGGSPLGSLRGRRAPQVFALSGLQFNERPARGLP